MCTSLRYSYHPFYLSRLMFHPNPCCWHSLAFDILEIVFLTAFLLFESLPYVIKLFLNKRISYEVN